MNFARVLFRRDMWYTIIRMGGTGLACVSAMQLTLLVEETLLPQHIFERRIHYPSKPSLYVDLLSHWSFK